jgi:hypothetical protein
MASFGTTEVVPFPVHPFAALEALRHPKASAVKPRDFEAGLRGA